MISQIAGRGLPRLRKLLGPMPVRHKPAGYRLVEQLPVVPTDELLPLFRRVSLNLYAYSAFPLLALGLSTHHGYLKRSKRLLLLEWIAGLLVARRLAHPSHEPVHAAVLYLLTGERPELRLRRNKQGYAYAAAPSWYFPRNTYQSVALAPLAVLIPPLLALVAFAPAPVLPFFGFMLINNVAGSYIDLIVAGKLRNALQDTYVNYDGHVYTFWTPNS